MRVTDERGSVIFQWFEEHRTLVLNMGFPTNVAPLFDAFQPRKVVLIPHHYFSNISCVVLQTHACIRRYPSVREVQLSGHMMYYKHFERLPLQYDVTLLFYEHLKEHRVVLEGDLDVAESVTQFRGT